MLEHFYEEGKPVGMICHGPAALLAALPDPRGFVDAIISNDRRRATLHGPRCPVCKDRRFADILLGAGGGLHARCRIRLSVNQETTFV